MRVTALVLGVIGGVVGLACGSLSVQAGAQLNSISRLLGSNSLGNALGGQQLVGAGALATLVSLMGIVGAGIALGRPRTAALLMLASALAGVVLIRADYLLAAGLLVSGALLAMLAPRPQQPRTAAVSSGAGAPPVVPATGPAGVLQGSTSAAARTPRASTFAVLVAWGIGVLLVFVTWWFWVLALFALLALAAAAWIPGFGRALLAWSGWNRLPLVARVEGWRATGLLFLLALAVLLIGANVAPRPPTL